jgi:DhnA family fructose-bisphosphate aldolase class Ia
LSAGVPLELVKRITGHRTADIVMTHYFRPDREQFKEALNAALPVVLTGGKPRLTQVGELRQLAEKYAAGTATDVEKKRLRMLATTI